MFNSIISSLKSSFQGLFPLPEIVTILAIVIFVVLIFKRLKLSPVIGYIVAGAVIGPYGLKISGFNDHTKAIAEFGIVFLLFSIGLELTFKRLLDMRKLILILGSVQFLVTSLVFGFICFYFTKNIATSLIVATSLSLSSTAIVLKLISENRQGNSLVGKSSLSVLLFQDLAVIPIFVLIPLLSQNSIDLFSISVALIVKSMIALSIIFLFGHFLIRPIFHQIAASKNNDLFIATTLLIILLSSWVTHQMGLSLALGAFISGVIIADTEFRHQVESNISQFRFGY